ncbi:hypothetical protein EI94DRAFT_1790216 [Lactarius quietus]|nr:hypothetical protein EI94DRAFT_1790216 [Lactarius quietus]
MIGNGSVVVLPVAETLEERNAPRTRNTRFFLSCKKVPQLESGDSVRPRQTEYRDCHHVRTIRWQDDDVSDSDQVFSRRIVLQECAVSREVTPLSNQLVDRLSAKGPCPRHSGSLTIPFVHDDDLDDDELPLLENSGEIQVLSSLLLLYGGALRSWNGNIPLGDFPQRLESTRYQTRPVYLKFVIKKLNFEIPEDARYDKASARTTVHAFKFTVSSRLSSTPALHTSPMAVAPNPQYLLMLQICTNCYANEDDDRNHDSGSRIASTHTLSKLGR